MSYEKINKERSFHDLWALILYIAVVGGSTYLMSSLPPMKEVLFADNSLKTLGYIVSMVTLLILFNIAGLVYFPGFLFIAAAIIQPILSIGLILLFGANIAAVAVSIFFSLLGIVLFFLVIYPNLQYHKALASNTAKKLFYNGASCFMTIAISSIIILAQTILYLRVVADDLKNEKILLCTVLFIFSIYWTFANTYYTIQVFTASTIAGHYINTGSDSHRIDTFKIAFKNTCYALGSICFGGFLMAILNTLYFMQNSARERRNRRDEETTLNTILYVIISIVILILRDILEFTNSLTFPYLALHGTSYKSSIEGAYKLMIRTNTSCGQTLFLYGFLISLEAIFASVLGAYICTKSMPEVIQMGNKMDLPIVRGLILILISGLTILSVFWEMVTAGTISNIYCCVEMPDVVQETDPQLYECVRQKL